MKLGEYIRYKLIATPLEPLALGVRRWKNNRKIGKNPEIADALSEDDLLHDVARKYVDPKKSCVDIGAHLGATTALFCQLAPAAQHYAVEATAYKAEWLRKKYPKVKIIEAAISDKIGEVTFFIQPKNSGYSGMGKHEAGTNSTANLQELKLPSVTLDSVVTPGVPIGFIKMDIEGAELFALRGAEQTIDRDRPTIVFECTKSGTRSLDVDPGDIYDFLAGKFGYKIYTPRGIKDGNAPLSREEFLKAMEYPFKAFSFVALK